MQHDQPFKAFTSPDSLTLSIPGTSLLDFHEVKKTHPIICRKYLSVVEQAKKVPRRNVEQKQNGKKFHSDWRKKWKIDKDYDLSELMIWFNIISLYMLQVRYEFPLICKHWTAPEWLGLGPFSSALPQPQKGEAPKNVWTPRLVKPKERFYSWII